MVPPPSPIHMSDSLPLRSMKSPVIRETLMPTYTADTREFRKEDALETVVDVFWEPAEERRAIWKIDIYVLCVLIVGFLALQFDRSNIANALTSTIAIDLNMTTDQLKNGNQIQIGALVAFEIPSNIVLQKFGASRWIIVQAVLWGLVATFQSFVNSHGSYYATRFLLGMFEAGFMPGSMYLMSTFYKRREMATKVAYFYFGNSLASAFGTLIAGGILGIEDKNWAAWRYLFMVEGCFTLLAAVLMFVMLPTSSLDTRPWHKMFNLFTEREGIIIQNRKLQESGPPKEDLDFSMATLKKIGLVLLNYRLWSHALLNFLQLLPKGGLGVLSPTIVESLGFSTVRANLLVSIGYFGGCIISVIVSIISDKTSWRGGMCFVTNAYCTIFAGVLESMTVGVTDKWTMFAMLTMSNAGLSLSQGLNDAWLSVNSKDPFARSIGLALCVIGSNTGGILGQAIFKDKDAPQYHPGFLGVLISYGLSLLFTLILMADYWFANKRLDKAMDAEGSDEKEDGQLGQWRYQM